MLIAVWYDIYQAHAEIYFTPSWSKLVVLSLLVIHWILTLYGYPTSLPPSLERAK